MTRRQKVALEGAFSALKSAAFEERVNRDRKAADWWRERSAMWFRRVHDETECST